MGLGSVEHQVPDMNLDPIVGFGFHHPLAELLVGHHRFQCCCRQVCRCGFKDILLGHRCRWSPKASDRRVVQLSRNELGGDTLNRFEKSHDDLLLKQTRVCARTKVTVPPA